MKIYFDTFTKKWTRPEPHQFPFGSRVYKGFSGNGKTLSMTKYAFDIAKDFPDCKIFANYHIRGLNNFTFMKDVNELFPVLALRNGRAGVLILIDEAHLWFNRKDGIPLDLLAAISQQRKDFKRLVFSSQIWEELDISLRKQVKEIVNCRTILKHFQFNILSDGETLSYDKLQGKYVAKRISSEFYKHYDDLYDSYDTYQKIISNNKYSRSYTPDSHFFINTTDKIKK